MSRSRRRALKTELKLRAAHNQWRIDSKMETIRCFLKEKFKTEFNQLVTVIPKLNGFLTYKQQNPEKKEDLTCPDHIFKMDFIDDIGECMDDGDIIPDIREMTLEENHAYRFLVNDPNDPCQSIDLDEWDTKTKTAYLVKIPYHDQNIEYQ